MSKQKSKGSPKLAKVAARVLSAKGATPKRTVAAIKAINARKRKFI